MTCHVCPSLPSWARPRQRWTSLPWSLLVAAARRYFPVQCEGAPSDRRSKVLWPFRLCCTSFYLSLQPKKSKATLRQMRGLWQHNQWWHPRQERLFCFIMCLNITGQRESDGEKLNRSIGYSSFRKPWLVSCSYSFRNKTCEKPQLRGENETMCGVGKTPSDVSVRNIILIFKNKTIY